MKRCPQCCIEKDIKTEFYRSKAGKVYAKWCKTCLNKFQKDRWKSRKLKAIEIMGGKCQLCGYNKNLAALEFHHIDPKEKEFVWNKLNKRSWNRVLEELKKCLLLCANCHRELHNPGYLIGEEFQCANSDLDRERISVLQSPLTSTGKCKMIECNNKVYGTTYCSTSCARLSSRKVRRPSKEELQKDILELNWSAIGRKYGVSDNAIRKWARSYGLLK